MFYRLSSGRSGYAGIIFTIALPFIFSQFISQFTYLTSVSYFYRVFVLNRAYTTCLHLVPPGYVDMYGGLCRLIAQI